MARGSTFLTAGPAKKMPALAMLILVLLACSAQAQRPSSVTAPLQAPEQSAPGPGGCCARLEAIGFSSPLPTIILDSLGQDIPYKVHTLTNMCTCSNSSDIPNYDGPTRASGRGNSSWRFDKKSYRIKLLKEPSLESDGLKIPFMGMPEDDDFILHGPENDRTVGIRNHLTYNLSRASGHWAARTVYCEVFLLFDGEELSMDHYNGVYIALENVKRSKDRIDIKKLKEDDVTGGYIFKYDNSNAKEGDVVFGPLQGWENPFHLSYPKEFLANDNGDYLLGYIEDFIAALEAPDWLQRQGNASYASFIDFQAAIDYFLLTELTKNPDGYRGSTYMYKDRGGPLTMGPVWDYDEAYGMCCGYPFEGYLDEGRSDPGIAGGSGISPEGWRFRICEDKERCIEDPEDGISHWFQRLWQDERFFNGASMRWAELRAGPWSDAALMGVISTVTKSIQPGVDRNFAKFSEALEVEEDANFQNAWMYYVNELEKWTLERVKWMDSAFSTPALTVPVALAAAGR